MGFSLICIWGVIEAWNRGVWAGIPRSARLVLPQVGHTLGTRCWGAFTILGVLLCPPHRCPAVLSTLPPSGTPSTLGVGGYGPTAVPCTLKGRFRHSGWLQLGF